MLAGLPRPVCGQSVIQSVNCPAQDQSINKFLLEHSDALAFFAEATTGLGSSRRASRGSEGLAMTRMIALQKPGGGVRGIATSDTFHRLVAWTLATA